MTVSISIEKLHEGIEKGMVQSKLLLDSSKILLDKKKFVTSISLSILSKEESAKVLTFRDFLKKNKPIDSTAWKELTNHKIKSALPFLRAWKNLRKMSEKDRRKVQEAFQNDGIDQINWSDLDQSFNIKYVQLLESLDFLKQDCQFINWINDDWFSILNNYGKKLQNDFANTFYYEALEDYYLLLLRIKSKARDPIKIPNSITGRKYKKIQRTMDTKNFKQMQRNTYHQIEKDYLPRHEELMKKINKNKKSK